MKLRNKKENAYNTRIQATFSDNLFFASSSLPVWYPALLFLLLPLIFELLRYFFFLSSSAYPRKECMCKPFSQFIFLDTRIIPFGVSVYLDQGETLPAQHKSWQPVELDLMLVFQSSLLTLGLGTHIFCLTPNNMLECSCCATGNLYLINQACSTDDVALEHRLWI